MNPDKIKAEINEKQQAMMEKQTKLSRLLRGRLRLPLTEVVRDIIPQLVHRTAEEWKRSPQAEELLDALAGSSGGQRRVPWQSAGLPWPVVCILDPEGAVRTLTALVHALPAYEAGPESTARPAVIEQLQREVAELERDKEVLVDKLQGGGVLMGSTGSHRREAAINAQPRRSMFARLTGKE